MIKYQLNITLYGKISLNSIRFDISLSQACCPVITEMPNGKMQCPGIKCVILIQTLLTVLTERRQYKEKVVFKL